MITRDSNYIDGRWQPAGGTERFEVTDSATEEVIATIPDGTAADVDAAVAAAKAAFPAGARWRPARRAALPQDDQPASRPAPTRSRP